MGLLLGPVLALLVYALIPATDLGQAGRAVLACTTLMAVYWVTEALPLPATALIPLVFLPLSGGASIDVVAPAFGNPVVFLYMGGFVLALALEKWNLHRRIALKIIDAIGTAHQRIVLGVLIATSVLSLFISNSATALMMLPVALALIAEVRAREMLDEANGEKFAKCLLLTVAYSATVAGLGTIVASVPNALFAAIVSEELGRTISFAQWSAFAMPLVLFLLVVLYFYLTRVAFRITARSDARVDFVREELEKLGPMGAGERIVAITFLLTAFLGVFKGWIGLGSVHDAVISMTATVALFALPAPEPSRRILEWADMHKLPWGILLLFGGGLALAASFSAAGVNDWIATSLGMLERFSPVMVVAILTLLVLAMTEILSNTAVSNLVLPLCIGLAAALGVDPLPLMAATALAAGSCYMLPVATPPNTAVFSSGELTVGDMARAGLWLNLVSIVAIVLAVRFWFPVAIGG